eukprot:Gb_17726 [translate_table: standard]
MKTLVFPLQDQFARQENQNRGMSGVQYSANTPEHQRRNEGAPTSLKAQVFPEKNFQALNKFSPVDYGMLPPPGPQFPHVNNMHFNPCNNMQFPSDNNLQFLSGNNFQFFPVNGLQSPPIHGLQRGNSWSFSCASPECDKLMNPGITAFPQPALFPGHPFPVTSPSAPPPMSSYPSFSGGNSVPGRRWHSVPEGLLKPPQPLIGANEIPVGGQTAPPLLRSRSLAGESSNSFCNSPERGVLPQRHPQPRPPKLVQQENNKITGGKKAHNVGRNGSEKQVSGAPRKAAEKNIVKKVVSAMKNARIDNSSESKGITILKRPPKAEAAVKNLAKAFGVLAFTEDKNVGDNRNGVSESHTLHGNPNFPHAVGNNLEGQSGCNICKYPCPENGGTDHHDARHCNCSMADRVLSTPDVRGRRKKESGRDLSVNTSVLNEGEFNSKECGHASLVEKKAPMKEWRPVENHLEPEGGSKEGMFLAAMGAVSFDDIGKEIFAVSPSRPLTENWAGPAYCNSPPPSSLPFPKFSMRQMRSVSLELPFASDDFTEAVIAAALPGSQSAPSSPTRDVPAPTPPRGKLQGFCLDVASATKDLRQLLNLDFNA